MGEKAVFESRDLSPAFQSRQAGGDKSYVGVEKRRSQRRSGEDRRASVRFENGGLSERRQNQGRREDDKSPQFW